MVAMVSMVVTNIRGGIARPHSMGDRLAQQFPFGCFRRLFRQI